MRRLFILILFNLCIASVVFADCSKEHPALKISKFFVPIKEDINYINPYILNIQCIDLLDKSYDPQIIKNYIFWYFKHTNYPDNYGLTGTIYDYTINCKTGEETSTKTYDSVDGYAGTFLFLLYDYYRRTKDIKIIQENRKKIEDIAYLIGFLQDKDGLIWALPDKKAKYLMDNCEAFGGIKAFNSLFRAMGWNINEYYTKLENSIKNSILTNLYDINNENFYWAKKNDKLFLSNLDTLYPDALSQLFPILYGILKENPCLETKLWHKFTEKYSDKSKRFPSEQRIIFELTKKKRTSR